MFKSLTKSLVLVCVLLFTVGCTVKSYVQDRSRVDQEMKGNAGCLQGTCPERGEYKKERQTFVIEVQTGPKSVATEETYVTEEKISTYKDDYETKTYKSSPKPVVYEMPAEPEPVFQDYKIENGDTLQKISKKFYDTYKNWYKIYEANKDVIKNPDRVIPGTVIRIPPK